jgi:PAS domain S-box-containing protein
MNADTDPAGISWDTLARICGLASGVIGILGLLGWMLRSQLLTAGRLDYIPMAPNTAFIGILLGAVLYSLVTWPAHTLFRRVLAGLIGISLVISGLTLAGALSGHDLGVDTLFISTSGSLGQVPVGHMSPVTATCFLLGGTALILLMAGKKDAAAFIGTAVAGIAGIILMGYWYGAPLLYGGAVIPVALPSAVALAILGIGLIAAAGPGSWPLSEISGNSTRAKLLRGILPVVLIIVLVVNWSHALLMGSTDSTSVLVSAVAALISAILVYLVVSTLSRDIGDAIDRFERERKMSQDELLKTNTRLNIAYESITAKEEELRANYEELALNQQALKKSEQRLRRFYDSGLFGVIFWTMDGKITDANDKFLSMVGYTRGELEAGRIDWVNMTPPEFRDRDENSLRELMATGINHVPFEKEYFRKDGSRLPILIAGAMLDEQRYEGVAFVMEISGLKHAEHLLRENESRLLLALEVSRMGTWELDLVRHTAHRNLRHDQIFGYDHLLPEWTYEMFLDHVVPEDREEVDRKFRRANELREDWYFDCRIRRTDGAIRWITAREKGSGTRMAGPSG